MNPRLPDRCAAGLGIRRRLSRASRFKGPWSGFQMLQIVESDAFVVRIHTIVQTYLIH